MEYPISPKNIRAGAIVTLTGSLCMLSGAAIWGVSGTDIDQALYDNVMRSYLQQSLEAQQMLVINLSVWIMGVILLGAGVTIISMIGAQSTLWSLLVR